MIARTEDQLVNFDCGVADFSCGIAEQFGNWMAGLVNWLAETSLGGQDFRPGDDLWNASITEAGGWLGMAIFVMMITFVVGIAGGALLQRPDTIKRTLLATAVSLPAVYFAYFIVGKGLAIIDEFSDGILDRLTGGDGFAAMIQGLFEAEAEWGAAASASVGQASVPPVLPMLLVLAGMCLGLLFIMFAMAFRNFVLMILIAFAPLAFVLLPAKGGRDEWVKRWMSAVVAMAIAKPIILGTLALVMAGFGSSSTVWSGAGLTLVIGFGITAFMPLMAYSFFQFIGGGTGGDDVGRSAGGAVANKTQRAVAWSGRRMPNGGSGRGGSAGGSAPAAQPASRTSNGQGGGGSTQTKQKSEQQTRPGAGPAANGRLEQPVSGGQRSTPPSAQTPPKQPQAPPRQPRPQPVAPPQPSRPATPQVPREPRR